MIDNDEVIYTSISVALEHLTKKIDESPQRAEMGYARAATVDARKHIDAYLDTKDFTHLTRADEIIRTASQQMQKWGHHV